MGSTSDLPVMRKAADFLNSMQVPFEMLALSAHRTPDEVAEVVALFAEARGRKPKLTKSHAPSTLPEALRREVEAHADRPEAIRRIGVEWAVDQCRRLKAAGIPVIHFYTMGRAENVRQIIQEAF